MLTLRATSPSRGRPTGWNGGHLVLLVLGAMLLWFGTAAVRAWLQPRPETPAPAAPVSNNGLLATVDPFFPGDAGPAADAPVTALALSLHGVRSDAATGRGSAILSGADGVQQVYGVGDTIEDGVALAAIAADHVLLDHRGVRESLWLDSGEGSDVQRHDPMAFDPMPLGDDDNLLPPSDAPAPAAGAAVLPAVPEESGGMG